MEQEERKIFSSDQIPIDMYYFKGIKRAFPPHMHEHYIFGLVADGIREFSYRNSTHKINPNELLILNPGESHSCKPFDSGIFEFYSFNPTREYLEEVIFLLTGKENSKPFFNNPIEYNILLNQEIKALFQMFFKDELNLDFESRFYYIMESFLSYSDFQINVNNQSSTKFKNMACEFIKENYNKNLSLDDISKYLSLSKYYFLHCFKKETGITPYAFLESVRIEKASKLLRQNKSILEVSLEVGFYDQSHFSKQFKKILGVTPKQYIEAVKV